MRLKDILGVYPVLEVIGSLDNKITGIEHDSRKIKKGNLFIAQKGFSNDGHKYIEDVIRKGASAIVIQDDIEITEDITIIKVANSIDSLAYFAGRFYNLPWRDIELIGITGTNGKTSTSYILRDILINNKNKVGVLGTIGARIGENYLPLSNTTPDSLEIEKKLEKMRNDKVEYIIMEVSSHALDLKRVRYMDFDMAIFTNLSPDHLDYHKTMDDYFKSKLKLFFKTNKFNIINIDDLHGRMITRENIKTPYISYGIDRPAHIKASNIEYFLHKTTFTLNIFDKMEDVELNLPGKFNLYNALAAVSCSVMYGVDLKVIKKSLENINPIKGRLEFIKNNKNLNIIIDFAHTPDGLENVLKTVRGFTPGKLIVVFGAGGNRDKSKRPMMGHIVEKFSDLAIITTDNPRYEEPQQIIEDIARGIENNELDYIKIVDRRKAIEYAIRSCGKHDTILIAGKGHEEFMDIKGKKYPFDEREIILNVLDNL